MYYSETAGVADIARTEELLGRTFLNGGSNVQRSGSSFDRDLRQYRYSRLKN
jgi:hypothetical protein